MNVDFQQLELFENWRPVPEREGFYEVSDWGRLRSVARKVDYGVRGHATYAGRLMVQFKKPNGYLCVDLQRQGKKKREYVHRLVALAFIGPCPIGKEVDHIDGDRAHNAIINLRYLHKSKNRGAKLTDDQVVEIRRLYLEGMSNRQLGKIFGVTESAIRKIRSGESHKSEGRV
jgi:HNH endonuclease/NUMOD4 motif